MFEVMDKIKRKKITEEQARSVMEIDLLFRQRKSEENLTEDEKAIIDYYYLKRNRVKGEEYLITDEEIEVISDSTMFIRTKRYKEIDKKELLKRRSELVKMAKERSISISYKNKTKKVIDELWEDYTESLLRADELYNRAKVRWEHIRDVRGLHVGLTDDYYLETTQKINWNYKKLNNRDQPISKIDEISKEINSMISKIKEYDNYENRRIGKIFL